MDTHHIHGTSVGFHGDTEDALKFLDHPENRHTTQSYLNEAKEHGEAHFYAGGKKFTVTHQAGEDGKNAFSVNKSHHH